MTPRRVLFVLLFICSLSPGLALAQDTAASLVDEGLDLREQGDDAGALARFEAAYRLEASPRTLAQIALAEMALGRWLSAEGHLREALGTQHEWIETNRVALNGAMAGIRDHIGRLQVESDADGAELWIGGERVGPLPLPQPLPREPGELAIEIRADGYQTEERTVTLAGGQVTRLVVALRREGAEDTSEQLISAEQAGVGSGDDGGGGISIPGVILVAVGGAAAITGAVLLGVAFAEKAALESPDGMPEWTPDEQSRADSVPVMAAAGEIAIGVGVAALGVGIVLMLVDGGGGDSQAAVRDGRLEVRF